MKLKDYIKLTFFCGTCLFAQASNSYEQDNIAFAKKFMIQQMNIAFENGDRLNAIRNDVRLLEAELNSKIFEIQNQSMMLQSEKNEEIMDLYNSYALIPLVRAATIADYGYGKYWVFRMPTGDGLIDKFSKTYNVDMSRAKIIEYIAKSTVTGSEVLSDGGICEITYHLGNIQVQDDPKKLTASNKDLALKLKLQLGVRDLAAYSIRSLPEDYSSDGPKENREVVEKMFPEIGNIKTITQNGTELRFVVQGNDDIISTWGIPIERGIVVPKSSSKENIIQTIRKLESICIYMHE